MNKTTNWKTQRDKALKAMVKFRKLGDNQMAENYLQLAVRFNQLRTEVEPVLVPKNSKLII